MSATPQADRRQHQRFPLAGGVEFFHGPTRREFPGRCVDISEGGMLMYVPAPTPVRVGQPIRLDLASVARPGLLRLDAGPMDGTIVRVDRQKLLTVGQAAVGVRFSRA